MRGDHGDRNGELHAAQRLQSLYCWIQAPVLDLLAQLDLESLQALVLLVDAADVFLEHNLLGRGGTYHFGQPAEMSGPPVGAAGVADVLTQQNAFRRKRVDFRSCIASSRARDR